MKKVFLLVVLAITLASPVSAFEKPWEKDPGKIQETPAVQPNKNEGTPRVIFNNWNIDRVYNNPQSPTRFNIGRETHIKEISNYHWNDGRGSSPGTISLVHEDGTMYGPWPVTATPGQGGAPNVSWSCYPNSSIPPGNYTVKDSDPSTWSHNNASQKAGFSMIKGY
jgi:hypothetical protein